MKRTLAFPPELKQTTTLLPTIITALIATTTGYAKYQYTYFLFFPFLHTPHKQNYAAYFNLSQKIRERL